jgi:tRNA U34 5-carboxymethylaminomethyl modifying GTPase MnmE/TrmE
MFDEQIDYALIAYEIKEATAQLAQLTGKTISEDAMNAIFQEFCVGK